MNIMDMKPLANPNATESSGSSRLSFIKFNRDGHTTQVRLVSIPYRRYFHFIEIERPDGSKQIKSIVCSNYDYDTDNIILKPVSTQDCVLDVVYDGQLKEQIHPDLPWVSFPPLPESYRYNQKGEARPPTRVTFQANFLAIDREVQKTDPTNCIQIAAFKKLAWGRILQIATGSSEGVEANPDFAKGDPANVETGYDLAVTFRKGAAPAEMYTVVEANTSSPLTEEEQFLLNNFKQDFDIEEYFRVRSNAEIIEYLEKTRTADSFEFGSSKNKPTADIIEAELKSAATATENVEVGTTPF